MLPVRYFEIKDRTMDNVQICDTYINNIPSSQTYRYYSRENLSLSSGAGAMNPLAACIPSGYSTTAFHGLKET
jgi:hypothetical protein